MTVSTAYAPAVYTGNGSTKTFTVPWPFFAGTELTVSVLNLQTGAYETAPVFNGGGPFDFTVAGTPNAQTGMYPSGSITFISAPQTYHQVSIVRSVAQTQTLVLADNGPMPAKSIEAALDRAILILQQATDASLRAIKQSADDAVPLAVLPPAVQRQNKFLAFDATGALILAEGTSPTLTPVSAFIATLLDDASQSVAQATLGVPGLVKSTNTFQLSDDGSLSGPVLELRRFSNSPAVNDLIGEVRFIGRNSTPGDQVYARITGKIKDTSAASPDGEVLVTTVRGTGEAVAMTIGAGVGIGIAPDPGANNLGVGGFLTVQGNVDIDDPTKAFRVAGVPLVNTKWFRSSALAIVVNGAGAANHGLGARPRLLTAWARCITAEHGFAVDDYAVIDQFVNASLMGMQLWANATQIGWRFGPGGVQVGRRDQPTGAAVLLTAAKWEVYIDAGL